MPEIKFVHEKTGKTYEFSEFPILIGRINECDLVLGGNSISKRHARLEQNSDGYHIYDLESLNGIKVNGDSVYESPLNNGDELSVGGLKLTFFTEASASDAGEFNDDDDQTLQTDDSLNT